MKRISKLVLLLGLVLPGTLSHAQSYEALENHSIGGYYARMEGVLQARDGNILTSIALLDVTEQFQFLGVHGYSFLKVSRNETEVLDSVLVVDGHLLWHSMLEADPDGDGYVFVTMQNLDTLSQQYPHLFIGHFDEGMGFNDSSETHVHIGDPVAAGQEDFFMLDNEIVLYYPISEPDAMVLSRFGLDGSLKHRAVIPDSICHINGHFGRIKLWNESPREYVAWGNTMGYSHYCVLDSLFGINEIVQYGMYIEYPPNISFSGGEYDDFESVDENTYVFTTHYSQGPIHGIQITKRDKATHENLKTAYFWHNMSGSDQIIGIRKSSDGNLYLAYFNVSDGIRVIKMDTELNVLWQRWYLDPTQNENGYSPKGFAKNMRALHDGGLVIGGTYGGACLEDFSYVFVLVLNEDGTSVTETEAQVRPYTYWPNPVQDELYLQYSPDIKPTQIELYDLQGRLVRTQRNGLERIGMEGLPAGTYTMRVTLEDGKVFSDKVVKE